MNRRLGQPTVNDHYGAIRGAQGRSASAVPYPHTWFGRKKCLISAASLTYQAHRYTSQAKSSSIESSVVDV